MENASLREQLEGMEVECATLRETLRSGGDLNTVSFSVAHNPVLPLESDPARPELESDEPAQQPVRPVSPGPSLPAKPVRTLGHRQLQESASPAEETGMHTMMEPPNNGHAGDLAFCPL